MLMKHAFVLFLSISLGYIVCVVAEKQKNILRTVGFTLGVAIIVLSLLYGVFDNELRLSKWGGLCEFGSKTCPNRSAKARR